MAMLPSIGFPTLLLEKLIRSGANGASANNNLRYVNSQHFATGKLHWL
jgi:hypothetical protein